MLTLTSLPADDAGTSPPCSATSRAFALDGFIELIFQRKGDRVWSLMPCRPIGKGKLASSSSIQPYLHEGEQLIGVNRLGDIIACAGFQTFFPVALHRLCRERQNGQHP